MDQKPRLPISMTFPDSVSIPSLLENKRVPKPKAVRPISVQNITHMIQQKYIIRMQLTRAHIEEFEKKQLFHGYISLEKHHDDKFTQQHNHQQQQQQQQSLSQTRKIMRNLILDNGTRKRAYKCIFQKGENGNPEWPIKTDIWCKHCSHPFNNPPIGIPQSFQIIDGIHYYEMSHKFFCSFNCTLAYILNCPDRRVDKCTDADIIEQISLLNMLCSESSGTPLTDFKITPAPPPDILKVFGGRYSIDEYREKFYDGSVFFVYMPPIIPIINIIEEHIPLDDQNV